MDGLGVRGGALPAGPLLRLLLEHPTANGYAGSAHVGSDAAVDGQIGVEQLVASRVTQVRAQQLEIRHGLAVVRSLGQEVV